MLKDISFQNCCLTHNLTLYHHKSKHRANILRVRAKVVKFRAKVVRVSVKVVRVRVKL